MVAGRVTPNGREAVISLSLGNPSRDEAGRGRWREVEVVIDTGFTDKLAVPPDVVEELNLPLRGSADVLLADGSTETLPMYRVLVLWQGRERLIRAYAAPGGRLRRDVPAARQPANDGRRARWRSQDRGTLAYAR